MTAVEAGIWTVIWRSTPKSDPWLLDFDDGASASACGVRLTEAGRHDVMVTGPQLVDLTPEDVSRIENVRVRVMARLAADRAEQIARERLARKVECQCCRVLFEAEPTKEMIG